MIDPRRGFALLLGTWSTHGVIVGGGEPDGAEILGTDTYEELGDRFVVHQADVTLNGTTQRTLEVFTLTAEGFHATAYTSDGTTETVTGSFDDSGVYRAGNDTTRTTLRITGDTMTARWEHLVDEHWRPWIHMTFTRRSPYATAGGFNDPGEP